MKRIALVLVLFLASCGGEVEVLTGRLHQLPVMDTQTLMGPILLIWDRHPFDALMGTPPLQMQSQALKL